MTATVDDANVITNDSHWTVDGQPIVFTGKGRSPKVTGSARRPVVTASAKRPTVTAR